jgi:hypothetical protein
MYGLAVMMAISTPTTSKNIGKISATGRNEKNYNLFY